MSNLFSSWKFLSGVDSLAINMEKQTMTVTGNVDEIEVVTKLRKFMHVDIETTGPNKEGEKNKDDGKDAKTQKEMEEIMKTYYYYNYYRQPDYSYYIPVQENPVNCVIS